MNRLRVDHLVLEFARRGYDELDALRDLRPDIGIGLGVVDIKDNGVETPDEIAGGSSAPSGAGRGPRPLRPSGLRLLDAEAQRRRRQNARPGPGTGSLRGAELTREV